uniref:Tyrosine specific protein phosphatases domain-containing protein n=1 Tax=Meloidogyne javanica TaxID=6303 RepID=A0A915LCD1_MELJA
MNAGKLVGHPPQLSRPSSLFSICEVLPHLFIAGYAGGKAVIYCAAGISRAATLTIMTLVINEGLTLREAYYTVVSARPIIAPNLAFWRQMIAWENEKNGKTTVHLLKGMRTPVPDVYLKKSDYMPPPESWEAPPKYTLTPKMGRKFNT